MACVCLSFHVKLTHPKNDLLKMTHLFPCGMSHPNLTRAALMQFSDNSFAGDDRGKRRSAIKKCNYSNRLAIDIRTYVLNFINIPQ